MRLNDSVTFSLVSSTRRAPELAEALAKRSAISIAKNWYCHGSKLSGKKESGRKNQQKLLSPYCRSAQFLGQTHENDNESKCLVYL